MADDKKIKTINITEITYGLCPAELNITFNEAIQSIDLNKIILTDISWPNVTTGFRITAVQAS